MEYKISSCSKELNKTDQNYYFIGSTDKSQDIFDFHEISKIFGEVQVFHANQQYDEAIKSLIHLRHRALIENPDAFPLFNENNIASILLDFLNNNFDFSFNRNAILIIIDFTRSNDKRYINQFISLSIIDKIKYFIDESNLLAPFALLEISYICNYKNTFDYLNQVDFNFDKFFQLLFTSHGKRSSEFMESFSLLSNMLNPQVNFNEIIIIIKNIDKFIKILPIYELSLYINLINFIVDLTDYDNFYDFTKQTELVPDLISLLYRINNPNDVNIKFVYSLLSIITFISQDSRCPEIQGSFLIDFYFNFQNPIISPFIFYIIGNLCKYHIEGPQNLFHSILNTNPSFDLINTAIQKGFINELGKVISNAKYYKKIEAVTCFSKIIVCSTQTMRIAIINSSGLNLVTIMSLLIDSLFFDTDNTEVDIILALLCLFEDIQKTLNNEEIASIIEETDLNRIYELDFEGGEENAILKRLKNSLEAFYNL